MRDYYQINQTILNEWYKEFAEFYRKQITAKNTELTEEEIEAQIPAFSWDGLMNMGVYDDNNQCQLDGEWPKGWIRRPSDSGLESKLWSEAPLRILYLTKDQNGGGDGSGWDVRFETLYKAGIDDEILRKDSIYKLIAYTLYGLTQSTKEKIIMYQELEKMSHSEILQVVNACAFARINVKKEVGTSSVEDDTLVEEMKKYAKYIIRQITALEPDIIVCCGNRNDKNVILEFLNNNYYCFKSTADGSSIHYDKSHGVVAIDSYHFAAHKGDENMYNDVVTQFFKFIKKNETVFPRR